MPLYEYECPKCGRFEALQKLSDSPLKTHDACGTRVRKLMSAGAFAFKGSGFYATDYGAKTPACDRPKGEGCASSPSNTEA